MSNHDETFTDDERPVDEKDGVPVEETPVETPAVEPEEAPEDSEPAGELPLTKVPKQHVDLDLSVIADVEHKSREEYLMHVDRCVPVINVDSHLNIRPVAEGEEIYSDSNQDDLIHRVVSAAALDALAVDEVQHSALIKDGTKWGHSLTHEGRSYGPGNRTPSELNGQKLTGREALQWIQRTTHGGGSTRVFLPRTGIWVTLKPPHGFANTEFVRRTLEAKEELGRYHRTTYFSNSGVYIREPLIDYILDHVEQTTAPDMSKPALRRLIKITDYNVLVTAFASVFFPDGYPITIPCIFDLTKCKHVNVGEVNIRRMIVMNDAGLTDFQRKIMTKTRDHVREEDLVRYEQEFEHGTRTVKIDNQISVVLKVPSLDEHIDHGVRWVTGVEEVVRKQSDVLSIDDRETFTTTLVTQTLARAHSHFVSHFIIHGEGADEFATIEDLDDVEEMCAAISKDDTQYTAYVEGISSFLRDNTLAVVGVPRSRCKACGHPLQQHNEEFELDNFIGHYDTQYLITMDAESVFFILARQKFNQETRNSMTD